jgi:hypothetical protein
MRKLTLLGALLLVLGIIGLAAGGFSFKEKDTVLKAGPLEINKEEQHHVSIPTILSALVAIAGVGLIVMDMRGKS